MSSVVWFRSDLRVQDNPALEAAGRAGEPVCCVYVDSEHAIWPKGGAHKVVLSSALRALKKELLQMGGDLYVIKLSSEKDFVKFCVELGAKNVFWNRRYDRYSIETDTFVKKVLNEHGITVESFKGSVLLEPWEVLQSSGKPYQVYSPMFRVYEKLLKLEPLTKAPKTIKASQAPKKSLDFDAFCESLCPKISWDASMKSLWDMSEKQAHQRLKKFLKDRSKEYKNRRDIPSDEEGTSRLSPYLALGVISPRQIFWEITRAQEALFSSVPGVLHYQKEVIWREFAYHLIYHFSKTDLEPLRDNFKKFPWEKSSKNLKAWQKGLTGYPIVDAAMRELWTTGYMHNRSRMIVASFLVKQLRIHWLEGAKWFWDTLVDADLASNTLGWQWSAGCGADAAPYFRIFNPVLQGEKFDSQGQYVKKWVPELSKMSLKYLHRPWEAPESVLKEAGVRLGIEYPKPIVDHSDQRVLALAAFKQISGKL